jgi:AcrR family transcriptional regulator
VPKLWTSTIETHRREVRDAIIETTAALVGKDGLPAVTMSRIAEEAGIGRATLYKYFPDVGSILVAWHDRHVEDHIRSMTEARDRSSDPEERLEAVLRTYASITYQRSRGHADDPDHVRRHSAAGGRTHHAGRTHSHEGHSGDIAALVHQSRHVSRVQRQLLDLIRDVISGAARSGSVRRDVPADELARYALKALAAAGDVASRPAVDRIVSVTLAGLRPPKR